MAGGTLVLFVAGSFPKHHGAETQTGALRRAVRVFTGRAHMCAVAAQLQVRDRVGGWLEALNFEMGSESLHSGPWSAALFCIHPDEVPRMRCPIYTL